MTPQELLLDPMTSYRFIVTLNPGDAHLPPQQAAQPLPPEVPPASSLTCRPC